ncbi:MAG: ABC transporter ATP-binding protein [Acidimicrobiia bacterium]
MSTDWRGVAAESLEDVRGGLAGFLRARSRRLLGSLLRPHRRALAGLAVVIVVENLAAMAGPYLVKVGIDRGVPRVAGGDAGPLVLAVAAFAAAALLNGAMTTVRLRGTGRVGQSVLIDLRTRVFDHFQDLSVSFHERYTSGRVVSRLTSDVEAIAELLDEGLGQLVFATLTVVSTGVALLVLDVPLALVALGSFPFLFALTGWFRWASAKAYRASRAAVALVIVQFTESLAGIRAVQAFRREPRSQELFEDLDAAYAATNLRSGRLGGIFGPGTRAIGAVTTAATLFVGAHRVLDGAMTVGVLAAFMLYVRRFFEPMQDLSQFFNSFQSAAAALEKLSGVLEEEPAVPEPSDPRPLPVGEGGGEVRFDHVSFGYRPDRLVLDGLDLTLAAGQTVALVGETGAGKSTIARLVARLYEPVSGAVLLDGVDLRHLATADLRRAVVLVTQEGFLFTGTIAENIAFGRPGATRSDIVAAAQAVGAGDFIASLPDGLDTPVGTRGGRLSAGQRQLVSFARAFLADPRVLVLDEATSSLDAAHERIAQRALQTLLAGRTAVVIAHRLATVAIADRILVIDGGRVVEDGPPSALATAGGRYSGLEDAWRAGFSP